MKKISIMLVVVLLLVLSGCADYTPQEVHEELCVTDYDYWLVDVVERNGELGDYTYTFNLDGDTFTMQSEELFSVGEYVLIVELNEEESILIDFEN